MVWLAVRGHAVVGSELSAIAVEEFFGEQRIAVDVRPHGPFRRHTAGAFEILEGDALDLTPELLGPVHAAYDRAALVALPAELRQRIRVAVRCADAAGLAHAAGRFRVRRTPQARPAVLGRAAEVERLYGPHFALRELERIDIIDSSPKFAAAGVTSLHEVGVRAHPSLGGELGGIRVRAANAATIGWSASRMSSAPSDAGATHFNA